MDINNFIMVISLHTVKKKWVKNIIQANFE